MPYITDLYPESPSNQFTAANWRESVGDQQPGGGGSFALDGSDANIVVQVPWNKWRSFLQFALGWSYADPAAPYRLHRKNPQSHPVCTWLHASSVQIVGLAPNPTSVGCKTAGAYADSLPVAQYQLIIATVRFTERPWTFLKDDAISTAADEYKRNTYFDPVPSVEVISAEGLNNIKFANGESVGVGIPAPFGTLMSKITKTLNWMYVPHEYISGSDTLEFTPNKIMSVVGRVNTDTFMGHPPGTLLLQAPVFSRIKFPVMTGTGVYGYFGWNIKFPMQFFDPDRGGATGVLTTRTNDTAGQVTVATNIPPIVAGTLVDIVSVSNSTVYLTGSTVSATGATSITFAGGTGALPPASTVVYVAMTAYRGHQLVPRRKDLRWYGALREDGTSKLYPEAAFSTIFTHVGAP